MISAVLKIVIWTLGLLSIAKAQNACSFNNGGYSLNWNVDNSNNVNFALTYANFPTNGNYWIAFSYDSFNAILISSMNGQVQISTANIQNSKALQTVGSNILQSQTGSLNNGNLQATFVIPLAALSAAAGGANCMQWQFYTTPTQGGSSYSGSPQTQQVCNLQQQCGQTATYSPEQYGNGYGPSYDSSLMGGVYAGSNNQNAGYESSTSFSNTGYQSTTPTSNMGYQSSTVSSNTQYQSTSGGETVGYTGPPYTGNSAYNTQQNTISSTGYNNQQQYSTGSMGYTNTQYATSNGQTYTSTPNPNGNNNQQQQQQQYSPSSNTQFNDAYSPSQNGEILGFPTTNSDNFVVANPNYIFLPPSLEQRYLDNELQGGSNNGGSGGNNGGSGNNNGNGVYRDPTNNGGNSYGTTTTEAPVLSNDAQNAANYQSILANPPTTAAPSSYTNNIYGYDYRSNQNMAYTTNGNNAQYQPPAYVRFQPSPNSPFRKKRQAFTQFTDPNTLAGTAYNGQNTKVSSSNANTVFYDANQNNNAQPNVQTNVQANTPATPTTNQYQTPQYDWNLRPQYAPPTAQNMYHYEQQQQLNNKFYYWNPTGFNQWNDGDSYYNVNLAQEMEKTTTTTENPFYPYVNRPYENSKYHPEANIITGSSAYLPYRTSVASEGYPQTYYDQGSTYNSGTSGSTSGSYNGWSSSSGSSTVNTDNVVNPQSPNYSQVVQQDQQAMQSYNDPSCTGTDPFWCQDYVSQFMQWQTQYDGGNSGGNNAPTNSVCQALTQSLKNSDHRCCQTVRQAGCSS